MKAIKAFKVSKFILGFAAVLVLSQGFAGNAHAFGGLLGGLTGGGTTTSTPGFNGNTGGAAAGIAGALGGLTNSVPGLGTVVGAIPTGTSVTGNSGGGGNVNVPGVVNSTRNNGNTSTTVGNLGTIVNGATGNSANVNVGNVLGAASGVIPGLAGAAGALGGVTVGGGTGGAANIGVAGVGGITRGANGQVGINLFGFNATFGGGQGWSFGIGGGGGCAAGGIGSVLCNVVASATNLPQLLSGIAYLAGLVLSIMAVIKLKDHVINPNQTPLSDSMKRFAAGGMFFALPFVLSAVYNTVGANIVIATNSGFNNAGGGGLGLSGMISALMADIQRPMAMLIGAFCYLAGIVFVMIGISRLLKTAQEGPRGPAGIGTIMTFLVGGALLSADAMMGAFSSTLFTANGGRVLSFGTLAYAQGLGAAAGHAHSVLAAILAFMMIVGMISFVRGWFIIRDVAEGNHQASLMAGMTHVFGGALAVNLGPALAAIQTTFGLTGLGIVFT